MRQVLDRVAAILTLAQNVYLNPISQGGLFDIDGDDTNIDGNNIDETYTDIQGSNSNIVLALDGTGTPITATTVLDGLTITGGNITNSGLGGGLYCNGSGSGHECSPTVSNVTLSGNFASYGGAIFNDGFSGASSPTLTNVTFSGNSAVRGGADSVTNPANYLLVEAGGDGMFDTKSCLGGVVTDDAQVPVAGVLYDSMSLTATVSLGGPLPVGTYRLFV